MYRMYRIDKWQRCIQSTCSPASYITGSRSVPTASAGSLMLWLFDVGYTHIGRFSEDMLINLDATQLPCMPMYCSDTCGDLSKRVGRVNTSGYIRYMTQINVLRIIPSSHPLSNYELTKLWSNWQSLF